jgi:hypothetical protein
MLEINNQKNLVEKTTNYVQKKNHRIQIVCN